MLPDFGTPLNTLVFEPNDPTLAEAVRNMIINSIQAWEPRITVQAINITNGSSFGLNPADDGTQTQHILGIQIMFFDPENIKEVQQLTLEVPLSNTGTTINTTLNSTAVTTNVGVNNATS